MIINKKSQTEFSGFYVVYKGSTMNETPENYGISHMVEHLKCKSFEKLYDIFDRYSISWNAYTSPTEVVFYLSGLDEHVYKYRHVLVNSLLTFDITEEQFETERKIVIQEYKDCFQDQGSAHFYNILRESNGAYSAIGKLKSLQGITYQDVLDFHDKYFSKPNMVINISKNSEFDGFNEFATGDTPSSFESVDQELEIENQATFNKTSIIGHRNIDGDFPYIRFMNKLLAGSLNSPLYLELREKRGLSYGVDSFLYEISLEKGIIGTGLITDNENYDEVISVYKDVFTNPEKYITETRFDVIKDYYGVLYKKQEINRYMHIDEFIHPKEWDLFTIIENLTYEDIIEKFKKYYVFDEFTWTRDNK